MIELIEHEGIVASVDAKTVFVTINSVSACGSCSANHICGAGNGSEKVIEVAANHSTLKAGDPVVVCIKRQSALKATLLAYVLPSVLAVATLIIVSAISNNELLAAALSLIIVAAYLFFLWLMRDVLKRTFTFSIYPKTNPASNAC
jgi:positive regulator of sigma E activity